MIDSLLDLPPHVRERLAVALESGLLSTSAPDIALQSVLGNSEWTSRVSAALVGLAPLALSGSA
ncbi:MAG: hypothetical protein M0038_17405, partial [Pseudomonadota bacterium]|nr:hypothetical protein [Pseudomonadota bacterium]